MRWVQEDTSSTGRTVVTRMVEQSACDGCRKIQAAQEEQSSLGWWNRVRATGAGRYKQHRKNSRHKDGGIECVRRVQEDTSSTGRTVVTRMVE